jgi:hypothetical protein
MANAKKQWTVMVYMAGDNNLDGAGATDLGEMKKVGSSDQVNIIVQFDRAAKNCATRRYYVRQGGTLENDKVADLGETNCGDPAVLQNFLKWGFDNYPAEHYLVVVWNHGNGWDDDDVYRMAKRSMGLNVVRRAATVDAAATAGSGSVSIRQIRKVGGGNFRRALFSTSVEKAVGARGIAYDDNAKDFLDNIEMKRVLAAAAKSLGRKIDILGMDACMMSMAEVGYQLRDCVNYTVGSEEIEPGDGWPYDKILTELVKRPTMSPKDLAKTIVRKYLVSYPANAGVTQSACDLAQSDALGSAIDALARALVKNLGNAAVRTAVMQARYQVQSYETADYIDLYDFCELLSGMTSRSDIRKGCQGVMNAIARPGYVIESGYKGTGMKHSHGAAIYFPQRNISPLYATLDFTKNTSWDDFLASYFGSVRRPLAVGRTKKVEEVV